MEEMATIEAVESGTDNQPDDIQLAHRKMLNDIREEEDRLNFWHEFVEHPQAHDLFNSVEARIQQCRVGLEEAKSDEVKTLQSDIRSHRFIMNQIRGRASDGRLIALRKDLAKFEAQNGLLVQAGKTKAKQ
jgi:hypothetical protein